MIITFSFQQPSIEGTKQQKILNFNAFFFLLLSQSSDRIAKSLPNESITTTTSRPPHTAYILQPPSQVLPPSTSANSSRNRIRDRKNPSSLRHGQKSTSTLNSYTDEQSQLSQQQQPSTNHMRSLDRKHTRQTSQNSSINSTLAKSQMKTSHTDIYGSLERNKHSKVSQPSLHGTILNDENDRIKKTEHQAHDFYHLTSNLPSQTNNTTSTIVNVGNVLQQQQQQQAHASFDQIDYISPTLPITSSATTRQRRPPPSVFQPHFDSSTTTPKDSYYTISGSKDVSSHPHPHIRGLANDNFYSGSYANKPPMVPPNQQQSMQRYDTSPLLVRRLETSAYPSQTTRYQPQGYNRTHSSAMMQTTTSTSQLSQPQQQQQPPPPVLPGRLNLTNPNHTASSSALLFRPHSSQSSSSQSSGYERI